MRNPNLIFSINRKDPTSHNLLFKRSIKIFQKTALLSFMLLLTSNISLYAQSEIAIINDDLSVTLPDGPILDNYTASMENVELSHQESTDFCNAMSSPSIRFVPNFNTMNLSIQVLNPQPKLNAVWTTQDWNQFLYTKSIRCKSVLGH